MTLDELRDRPSIKAHWPEVGGSIDQFLVDHLIDTCLGQSADAQTAEAQVGASKAIANVIKIFRSLSTEPKERKKVALKPLNRMRRDAEEAKTPETPK